MPEVQRDPVTCPCCGTGPPAPGFGWRYWLRNYLAVMGLLVHVALLVVLLIIHGSKVMP